MYPLTSLDTHQDKCSEKPEVDATAYNEYVEKQAKKLAKREKGKVVVEDDFIEPNDFRDPGGRKKRDGSGEKIPGSVMTNNSQPKKGSVGRKSTKSNKSPGK